MTWEWECSLSHVCALLGFHSESHVSPRRITVPVCHGSVSPMGLLCMWVCEGSPLWILCVWVCHAGVCSHRISLWVHHESGVWLHHVWVIGVWVHHEWILGVWFHGQLIWVSVRVMCVSSLWVTGVSMNPVGVCDIYVSALSHVWVMCALGVHALCVTVSHVSHTVASYMWVSAPWGSALSCVRVWLHSEWVCIVRESHECVICVWVLSQRMPT